MFIHRLFFIRRSLKMFMTRTKAAESKNKNNTKYHRCQPKKKMHELQNQRETNDNVIKPNFHIKQTFVDVKLFNSSYLFRRSLRAHSP